MKINITTIFFAILIIIGIVFGAAYRRVAQVRGPHLAVVNHEFDFGKIRQSGGVVSATFEFLNDGDEDVVITDTIASCSCTSAEMDKKTLAPGERGILTVRFDPNYHYESEEKFFRTVVVKSNIQGEAPEIKIWAQVDYDLGKDKLKFPSKTL